ncbi:MULTISPECIES: exopolysaccharide biosynthesis protein [Bradyrhizobium]|uniref:exopolysaccharide biosynthesis protein n=1 Tax=Bradyrhizobium TaxID=374 RepID=UPI00188A459C|nr:MULTISPECIES: exopolysaccharide biosynthesis protein [Bradyrhizobium]MCC8940951.1 exopolysaccharide biosynthesis protein [Bradyrhizobium ivorense]
MAPPQTSQILADLVAKAPDGPVDLEWLLGNLDKRSFGLLLLLLGLLVIIPGIATIATLALLFPAVEMMLGRRAPSFPRVISKRQFDFKRFKRFTIAVSPMLQAIERISRPRWDARHDVIDRLVGLVVFLLAFSAGWPLPLVNVIPGMVVVLIAVAYLQEDGLLLAVAMAAALLCLLGLGFTLWASASAVMEWMAH